MKIELGQVLLFEWLAFESITVRSKWFLHDLGVQVALSGGLQIMVRGCRVHVTVMDLLMVVACESPQSHHLKQCISESFKG